MEKHVKIFKIKQEMDSKLMSCSSYLTAKQCVPELKKDYKNIDDEKRSGQWLRI